MRKKLVLVLLTALFLLGASLLVMGVEVNPGKEATAPEMLKSITAPMEGSAGKKMVIEIDIETGKVLKVTDGKKAVKPKSLKEEPLYFGKNKITDIPDYTLIRTHSSPGCCWYFWGGWYWYICF